MSIETNDFLFTSPQIQIFYFHAVVLNVRQEVFYFKGYRLRVFESAWCDGDVVQRVIAAECDGGEKHHRKREGGCAPTLK